MSTFLQLCSDLRQETVDSGTGPTTVVGQSGELGRTVKWVKDAWYDIQLERSDWKWRHKYFTLNTVASTRAYAYTSCVDTVTTAAIARFSSWYEQEFKCYLSASGVAAEYPLIWMEFDAFRRVYMFGTQAEGQPCHVSMDNTMKIVLGPIPDAVYVVSGGYVLGPQTLAADADEPELPAAYHRYITYEAMSRYGGNRVAPEAMLRAASEGGRLRSALELNQLPSMTYGDPLA